MALSAQAVYSEPPPLPIVLGTSTALTGPTNQLGQNMKLGLEAAFSEVNNKGGIRGRQLKLIALDDGYEPNRTSPNMRKLTAMNNLVAVIGNVGTPTAVAALPIAIETKTPFIGAFTGAGILRKSPPDRYVVNYRASYAEETHAMVSALIQHGGLKPQEIGFFTQRDAYGDSGYVGAAQALKEAGLVNEHLIVHGRYERNTLAVENGLADILQANSRPKALIMVGAYAPIAEFIRLARDYGFRGLFLNVSFVGATSLSSTLGKRGEGVIITQVVPHYDANLPLTQSYRRALAAYDETAQPSFTSIEGYITASIFIKAMENYAGEINREGVIEALDTLGNFEIGMNAGLNLGVESHQASHRIWPTVMKNGKIVPFDWKNLPELMRGLQ